MVLHPAWSTILRGQVPSVKLTDLRNDVSDLTTYTFTNCAIGPITFGVAGAGTPIPGQVLRSSGFRNIAVIVHGEDAATSFSVTGVTIGGVSGTEQIDRVGATSAINTAIYTWAGSTLDGIANTNIAVTWSEAITSCAIGVLSIENMPMLVGLSSASAVGTGVMNAAVTGTATLFGLNHFLLGGR